MDDYPTDQTFELLYRLLVACQTATDNQNLKPHLAAYGLTDDLVDQVARGYEDLCTKLALLDLDAQQVQTRLNAIRFARVPRKPKPSLKIVE